jgi:charged multivesicular body protein 6
LFSRALLLLRKKKFQEQVLIKADGQLENLERMVHDLEFAQVEIKVIDGLKFGNDALKKLHAILSIEEIEKIMDETKDSIEKQQEINTILTGTLTDEDEEDVEAELNALISKDAEEVSPEETNDLPLPDVPTDRPTNEKGIEINFLLPYKFVVPFLYF